MTNTTHQSNKNQVKVLKVNASGRYQGSVTRQLTDTLANYLNGQQDAINLIDRDLAKGVPFIDEQWIGANFTAEEDRNDEHKAVLSLSDTLVNELQQADHIVIGAPVYNFNIPAALKAWIDLIARARLTFQYTENGPEGLLKDKKVYIVFASGGVPIGSEMDFTSNYLKHVLAFVGLTDVTFVDAAKIDLTSTNVTEEIVAQLTTTSLA
jgi:FMN-dependent NADH-azoreductase